MRDYSVDPKRVYVGDYRPSRRGRCHGSNVKRSYAAIGVHLSLAYGAHCFPLVCRMRQVAVPMTG